MSQPDHILLDAIAKRDAAQSEAARWSNFIDMYCEIKGLSVPSQTKAAGTIKERPQQSRGGALAETEKVAVEAIRKAGRPMHTQELLTALLDAGIEVGGKDPASTLSARLSRAPSLENARPHGWRIKSSPLPEAATTPFAQGSSYSFSTASNASKAAEMASIFDQGGRDDGSDLT